MICAIATATGGEPSAVWSPHVHLDFVVCARHGWRVDDALLDRLGSS